MDSIPNGFCHCGCGERTNLVKRTIASRGLQRGDYRRYVVGHVNRRKKLFTVEDRGFGTPCHISTIKPGRDGYCRTFWQGKYAGEHRLVYEAVYGPLPPGVDVHHRCQQKACRRADHLEAKPAGQHRSEHKITTRCKHGHEWQPETTYIVPSTGKRSCLLCRRERYERVRTGTRPYTPHRDSLLKQPSEQ